MNKFLKLILIAISSFLAIFYIAFLIIPPIFNSVYNLDKYKNDLQKIVKDNAKLNLDYSNIKIYTTPLLSAGIAINDIKITLDDNSQILSADKIKGGIALPSLLTLTIKTSNCEIVNPYINLEIVNNEQYKIISIVEDIINENNAKPKAEVTQQSELINKITEKIRIKVPFVKITNLKVVVDDLKSKNNLKLIGEKLILGYNGARNTFKINTNAKLLSNDKENVNINLNISSSIPKSEKIAEQKDPEEKIAIPFVNPVTIYQTYDLNANINSKIKIRNTKYHGLVAFGYFNIDDINLKLSDIRLPNSFIHSAFQGKIAKFDSNLYAKNDEKIALNGELKYGSHPRIKTTILSDKLHFENLLSLLRGLLDSLNVKNELAQIKTTGYLVADATIKTNFKKLKSTGSIVIKDGSFINPKSSIGIKDIIANLIFDNNVLNIKETSLTINNSKLNIEGQIDSKSIADIKLNVNQLSIPELFNAFAPRELKKSLKINSAKLSANVDIKGKLDNLNASLNAKLSDLNLCDAAKSFILDNQELNLNFGANSKEIKGQISNNNFKINLPQIKTKGVIEKISINLDNEAIKINPFDFIYNDLSKINVKGEISNYLNEPDINVFLNGKISTKNINQTLGKELTSFIPSKGIIPIKVSINGDLKNQEILAQIFADANNYISPIVINKLHNAQSLLSLDVKIQKNKIKIKDSGLFKTPNAFSDNLSANLLNTSKIIDLTAILDNGHINLFRINIPEELSGKIAIFNKSTFNTKGKITLNGDFDDLNFGGDLKISNINIPEILFKTNALDLDFISNGVNLKAKEIDVNNSKINASLKVNVKNPSLIKIDDIDINSKFLNVDKMMKTVELLTKYVPQQNSSSSAQAQAQNANIPIIAIGKFDIKKLITGNMIIENIKGNTEIKNNDLIISSLNCDAFEGDIKGMVKMNLITSLLTIKLDGKNLNADKALSDAANMKNTISGKLNFKTDISLKGATYEEQIKSLKGDVLFDLKDGQYGPFAKLENFFLAENIKENPFFKNTIGVILTPLTTIDSTHFEDLNGKVTFNNGVVDLGSIKSQGDILCILIKGNMNLLTNKIDSKVKVRLASAVSDMLGPIAMANPINLVKNTPGLNVASSKLFSVFSQVVTEEEYKEIPDFAKAHSDNNATKFQIVLNGDVAKPLTLVKSFKWLALQEDMNKAKEFSANYEKEALLKQLQEEYEQNHKLKVGVEKILQMDTTAPEVKEIIKQETQKVKEQTTQSVQKEVEVKKESVKQEISTKAQELEKKVQNKIETKKQEEEQKLIDAKNKLKSKFQEKLNLEQKMQNSSTETNTQETAE